MPPCPHSSLTHKTYRLTCEQYDQLLREAAGQCRICGIRANDTWRGKLSIDHDDSHGSWAVRGLICSRCNTAIGPGVARTPEQEAYLAAPWFRRALWPLSLDEPDDGTCVNDGAQGRWQRRGELWFPVRSYYRDPQSWGWLIRMFGPHRVHQVQCSKCTVHRDTPVVPPNVIPNQRSEES